MRKQYVVGLPTKLRGHISKYFFHVFKSISYLNMPPETLPASHSKLSLANFSLGWRQYCSSISTPTTPTPRLCQHKGAIQWVEEGIWEVDGKAGMTTWGAWVGTESGGNGFEEYHHDAFWTWFLGKGQHGLRENALPSGISRGFSLPTPYLIQWKRFGEYMIRDFGYYIYHTLFDCGYTLTLNAYPTFLNIPELYWLE